MLIGFIFLANLTERAAFAALFINYSLLFAVYIFAYKYFEKHKTNFNYYLAIGISTRIALFFVIPNLSDDFYRFIWDGNLFATGINPFDQKPSFFIDEQNQLIYEQLNSKEYFTIYPAICQYIFGAAAIFGKYNLIPNLFFYRMIFLIIELIAIKYLVKILQILKLPQGNAVLYILNPLLIIESYGNLHFELLGLSILIIAFYFYLSEKKLTAIILFALGSSIKLTPLIILPLLIFREPLKNWIFSSLIIFSIFILLHIPFFNSTFLENFLTSLQLYFNSFEFNASIYYIVRWLGFQIAGYNIIAYSGKILSLIGFFLIIFLSFRSRKVPKIEIAKFIVAIFTTYYLLATTIHPWYILNVFVFSIFTKWKFPLFWTFSVFLSYFAYSNTEFQENFWLIFTEYALLFTGVLIDVKDLILSSQKSERDIRDIQH